MIAIDTVTALPIDTTHGSRCTSALERRVRHTNVAAVRECDRLSRIQDEIMATAYATELADANRARYGSPARMIAYYRP
jgi:hypothetical protein